ncbi:MAG: cysteine synthase CysM [Flavobacteriaceae bacterium]|nr:cysteine synthase CysM [Flavobacteriaceae bacterium]
MTNAKILNLIGNTPLVEVSELINKPSIRYFLKLEGNNPAGSVKDRAAYSMIKRGLENGKIHLKSQLIEATSGNTGIALAMIAACFGIDIELVMPESATQERIDTMRAYGAKVTLTSAEIGIEGARDYAALQVKQKGKIMLNQFANPHNWMAHFDTTGPEIYRDSKEEITHFVSAMGTTGTMMGCSRFLKQQNSQIKTIGVQPTEGSKIAGIRRWNPDYIPAIYEAKRVDQIIDVSQEEAKKTARMLARKVGVFCGMSSGGATAAALKLAETIDHGCIVSIVCDRGDRYLSSDLFD